MYVHRLNDAKNLDNVVNNPSPAEIVESIRTLDGEEETLITIDAGAEVPHMGIGGGPIYFIVYATYDNLKFFTALGDKHETKEIELVVGGELASYSLRVCVTRQIAELAATEFAMTGKLADSIEWEQN
jgi:hypothetical protein